MENVPEIKTIQICRTCMDEIIDTSVFVHLDSALASNTESTIKQKLSDCIPELDLHITANAVICNKCVNAINVMHKFKNECLRSEMLIHKYMQQVHNSGNVTYLVDVARFHQVRMEFKTEFNEIPEDFEINGFQNEALTTTVCDANAVKQEYEGAEIMKEEYVFDYSISTPADISDKYDGSNIVRNFLPQVNDRNDGIQNLCKSDMSYECFTCGCKAESKSKLILHLKTCTSKKPFKCPICEHSSTDKSNLKRHMQVHTGEKPFKCSFCEYSCILKGNLKRHMLVHTGEKPFKCSLCVHSFIQKSDLNHHMLIHTGEKPLKCSFCDYSCIKRTSLKCHMRIHTGEKPFKCILCDYSGWRKGNLTRHLQVHTGEKPFKCSLCEYSCTENRYLKRHIMHIHTGVKPFVC